MADLVTTISETVTLNGSLRGSSNTVTTTEHSRCSRKDINLYALTDYYDSSI
jgi:hypothetical protein